MQVAILCETPDNGQHNQYGIIKMYHIVAIKTLQLEVMDIQMKKENISQGNLKM